MIAQFALRMMFGISVMWTLMPRDKVSTGFFRIQMLITMGLSVLAALTFGKLAQVESAPVLSSTAGIGICIGLAVVAFFGSVVWTLGRRRGGNITVFLVFGLSSALLAGSTITDWSARSDWLALLGEITTAGTLGGAMTGMLLGHWYLTATTMSIEPLSKLNQLFGIAVGLRLAVSAWALFLGWNLLESQTHWLWLSLRWLAGIVGPLVLLAMVARILRYKNTQSATGVLFVGVILTFIGELSATLLARELHMPF